MLNRGGILVVTTTFLIRIHEYPIDCSRWTPLGLQHLLRQCGFLSIETGRGATGVAFRRTSPTGFAMCLGDTRSETSQTFQSSSGRLHVRFLSTISAGMAPIQFRASEIRIPPVAPTAVRRRLRTGRCGWSQSTTGSRLQRSSLRSGFV
jgi:hypothetical protein